MLLEQRYSPKDGSRQQLTGSSSPVNNDTDTTVSVDTPSLPVPSESTKSAIDEFTDDERDFRLLKELPLPHVSASPLGGTIFDLVANHPSPFGQEFDVDHQADFDAYSISIPSPNISGNLCNLDEVSYLATPEDSPTSITSGTFYDDQYASSLGMFPSFPQATPVGPVEYCASMEMVPNASTTSVQFMQRQQRDNRVVDGTLEEGKIFREKYPQCKSTNRPTPNVAAAINISGIVSPEEAATAEIKRQVHIQTEQKRRAQIKDGFEELKKYLPNFINKKMSKAAILHKTIQYLQQLKANYLNILREYDNVVAENLKLKSFLGVNMGASHPKDRPNDNPGNFIDDSSTAPSNSPKDDAIFGH